MPAAAVPAIEQMIRSGNGLGASMQIVTDMALGAHVPIETLGQTIKSTTTDLAAQKREQDLLTQAMARTGTEGAQVLYNRLGLVDAEVEKLTGRLQVLQGLQAAFGQSAGPKPLTGEDRYVAQLQVQASLAGENARKRHIDSALIERATEHLQAQGRAEHEVVRSAEQARKILGDQAAETERIAAASYVAPKGARGPNVAKQDQHIGDEEANAYREANDKKIENAEATNAFLLQMGQRSVDEFVAQARDLENQRYAIEVKANADKEKSDGSDRVALAKDIAQEEVLRQAHAGRMNEIDRTEFEKRKQMRDTDFQDFARAEESTLSRYLKSTDAQYTAGAISSEQKKNLEQGFTAFIENEILRRFDAEHAHLVAGTEAYKQAMKDRQAIVDGFSAKFETQQDKFLTEEAQQWKTFSSEVRGSFNSALDQLIVHGGTFQQFMLSAVQGVGSAFLNMGTKIAGDWIENQIRMMLADDVSFAEFLAKEDAKVAAVLAGQGAQVGAVAAGTGAKNAIEAAGDSKSILNSAYTAAAKAYASVMQSVPPPFNLVAAPAIAAGTFAAVAAFDVISAEGGLDRVAYNGQMIRAHVDESVFPARIARPMIRAAESGAFDALANMANVTPVQFPSSNFAFMAVRNAMRDFDTRINVSGDRRTSGSGGVTHEHHYHLGPVTIHALDGRSVERVMDNPAVRKAFARRLAGGVQPRGM